MKCNTIAVLGLSGIIAACSLARQNDSDTRGEGSPLESEGIGLFKKQKFESIPFRGGQSGYKVYRAPTMAISKSGTVLAFSEGRVNGHEDEDDMDVVLRRSHDGGKTWEKLQVLVNDGKNPCKNQSPVVLPSGRILLLYLWNPWIASEKDRKNISRKMYMIYSDDDGKTWSNGQPGKLGRDITEMTQKMNGPDAWAWTGLGPVHGIVKQFEPNKGRIIFPSRHNAADTNMVSHVIYSDDSGENWKIGGSVPRAKTTESTVVELSNGNVMLNSRNQTEDEFYRVVSISKDGGKTFLKENVKLDSQLIEPRGVQASLLFHSIDKTTKKGIILFSNPADRELRSNGSLRVSTDDGLKWSETFVYAPKPKPYFTGYSDIARFEDGNVAVLYERGEYDENNKGERYDEIGYTVISIGGDGGISILSQDPKGHCEMKSCLGSKGAQEKIFEKITEKSCRSECSSKNAWEQRRCRWKSEKNQESDWLILREGRNC
jgi:sialidase-1